MKVQCLLYFASRNCSEKYTAPVVLIVMKEYVTQMKQYGSFMDWRQKQCQALTKNTLLASEIDVMLGFSLYRPC